MGRGPDGRRMCKLCGLTGGDVTRIKNHIESVHWPHSQGYACEQCNAICKTRHALACHKSRHHPKNKPPASHLSKKSAAPAQKQETETKEEDTVETPPPEVEATSPEPEVTPVSRRDSRFRGKRAAKKS